VDVPGPVSAGRPATVGAVARAVAREFPVEWAEPWDRVGLLAGNPDRPVTGVLVTLDPTPDAIARAHASGANVVVSHHPAFLTPPERITPGRGPAGVIFGALDRGIALIAAHTNLDRAPAAGELLPRALGLEPDRRIERGLMRMALVTVYVPPADAERVTAAMAGAGAGRIGDYERCSFSASGTGAFTPAPDAAPAVGTPGEPSTAEEVRLEMVAPPHLARGVASAARAAHPYEEPLVTVAEVDIARSLARMGMLSRAADGATLADLARVAADAFGITPRVWGDPDAPAVRVATATGSAGSLIGDVLAAGAQALVTGEVRYHDALDSVAAGLAIIELGHDVSEWPLVPLLAAAVRRAAGLDPATVRDDAPAAGWWTP